MNQGKGNS